MHFIAFFFNENVKMEDDVTSMQSCHFFLFLAFALPFYLFWEKLCLSGGYFYHAYMP